MLWPPTSVAETTEHLKQRKVANYRTDGQATCNMGISITVTHIGLKWNTVHEYTPLIYTFDCYYCNQS